MSRFIRSLVVVASLATVLSISGVASANQINGVVARHEHPNVGFWHHASTHHARTQARPIFWLFR